MACLLLVGWSVAGGGLENARAFEWGARCVVAKWHLFFFWSVDDEVGYRRRRRRVVVMVVIVVVVVNFQRVHAAPSPPRLLLGSYTSRSPYAVELQV